MAGFDYDVLVIGAGFGGGVTAMRAAEKGYSVAVLESGKRWNAEDYPKTNWNIPQFLWFPGLEMYGMQRMEVLDEVFVLCSAGVGGGSNIYGNALYVPGPEFFDAAEWSDITDWGDELAPYIDQAQRMLGVQRGPYMPNDTARLLWRTAKEFGREHTFQPSPSGVFYGDPGVEVDDPYFGGKGPRRAGCVSCSRCMVGCPHNAKNTVQLNYLYLAEAMGASIFPLQEVYEIKPLDGGGYEVMARHPGWAQRAVNAGEKRYTAEQVVVTAHAYGTAKLLLKMQHEGQLDKMSTMAGRRARDNDEEAIMLTIPYAEWKDDPDQMVISRGTLSEQCSVWIDDRTSIQPNNYGIGNDVMGLMMTYLQHGRQEHPIREWLKQLVSNPSLVLRNVDIRHWAERTALLIAMQTHDNSLDLYWDGTFLRSKQADGKGPQTHIPEVEQFVTKAAQMAGMNENTFVFELINRGATAHFIGGMPIGESAESGAVDPYQRVFGHPGLHVLDGSVMPANPGVNPTLTLTALAERAMSFWPNKGEKDTRPPLGSGYSRINAVMPNQPYVPAGAPGELRLDATKDQVLPKDATTGTV